MAKHVISQFTMPNGDIVEIKDKVAREAVAGGTHFLGVTTTEVSDGSPQTSVTIGEESKAVANGDIVVNGNKEFIYAESDAKWHELGDVTNLGALALKDTASASYTPAGEVTFSGAAMTSTGSYTPEGSVAAPEITMSNSTTSIDVFSSAGTVTAGSPASATMPTLVFTPDANENLTISWTDGTFTANVPTAVTLPTSKSETVMTGASATASAPAFTGAAATLSVSGTPEGTATFSGTSATITVA